MRGRPRPPPPWVHRNVSIRSSSDAAALAVRGGVRLHTDHRVAIEQVISLDTKAHHRRLGEALRAGGLSNWNREPEETRADPGGFEGGGGCHTFCLLSGGKIRGLPTFPWIRAWEEHCPQVFGCGSRAPDEYPARAAQKCLRLLAADGRTGTGGPHPERHAAGTSATRSSTTSARSCRRRTAASKGPRAGVRGNPQGPRGPHGSPQRGMA